MRVAVVSATDITGGAGRASYRIHHALRQAGHGATMHVTRASAGDWTVEGPKGYLPQALVWGRHAAGAALAKVLNTDNPVLHSPAVLPSSWPGRLNRDDCEVVNLHWVNAEMMSVEDIGRIRKPVVWTLHDMWAFCGAEHYTTDERWRTGYLVSNRPSYERGLDLNRWVWRRKQRAWRRRFQIVTPSQWLADCVRDSGLMHDWPVTVIPNAIDTDAWQPVEVGLARRLLGLPIDVPIALFGAIGGSRDSRKGFDLLEKALRALVGRVPELMLAVFGQLAPRDDLKLGFPVRFLGHLHDDISLRLLYSAADLLVIPSRQDNLPNTGVEALACGTPVVAFNACGLPSVVDHRRTGYLAEAFEPDDLAAGVEWVLAQREASGGGPLRSAARQDAVDRLSYPVVATRYLAAFRQAMDFHG
ncbi:MAG: glycosyltransferase [Zoogloeaceae bacterium]|nr:glycosyltransferase [Zoogloeaceae bacterium]